MDKKILFTVENLNIIDENQENDKEFATLKIDAFASGNNKHGLYVSEETLRKTASTILQKPLVWVYNKMLDDIGSHDPLEVPCGFVPHNSPIDFRELDDGRIMMSIIGKIWKRYSGRLMELFERDKGTKPVSVEIDVLDFQEESPDKKAELFDYVYNAITILGSLVTPAIPLAKADVLAFAEKERDDYELALMQFNSRYDDIDFKISEKVKKNVEIGLSLYREHGRGGTSVSLALARYIVNHDKITHDRIKYMAKVFKSGRFKDMQQSPPSNAYISFMLHGGVDGRDWSLQISNELDRLDSNPMAYFEILTFPYTSLKDINPALKGIHPPITLEQANSIARQADAIGADKGGWGIAIDHFKKSHKVEDGRWVKREKMENFNEDMGTGKEIKVNKSKESLSNSPWGSVDKTALRNKVLKASNYKSLVKDVYALVESGWEESPSSHLKYPIMQINGDTAVYNRYALAAALGYAKKNNESAVVSKVNGIYEKMGLDSNDEENEKEMAMEKDDELKDKEKDFEKDETNEKEEEEKDFQEKDEKEEEKDEEKNKDAQDKEEDDKEDEKEQEKKENMSLSANLDVAATLSMLQDETESYEKVSAEFAKPDNERDFSVIAYALFCKMCKLAEKMSAEKDEHEKTKAENEELKKFKAEIEKKEFEFAVNSTLKEVEGVIPADEINTLREEVKDFALADLEGWKNSVRAKAFTFSQGKEKNNDYGFRMALPFANKPDEKKEFLW